jgi:3-oxoacyl-[acyl-carrier protein] reductase
VTGPGRGIGHAVALKLAGEGAQVVVNDLDEGPAKETVTVIEAAGGEAVACTGSVTSPGFAERFVHTAVETYGGLDIIVNNAGYTWDSVVSLMSADGVPIEEIARLAGHNRTATTELVYRHELRPVITTGAEVMDRTLNLRG